LYDGGNATIALQTNGASYFNAGNVGIGTTSPSSKLQVDGTITVTNGGINIPADSPIRRDGDNSIIGYSSALPGINIGSGTVTDMVIINAGGVERIRVNTLGNVGIGTAAPSYRLDVVGTIGNNGGGVQFPREFSNYFTPNAERADIFFFSNFTSNNALRIGTLASSGGTTLQSTRANDSSLKTSLLLNPAGGNVGIGTTSPNARLTVVANDSSNPNVALRLSSTGYSGVPYPYTSIRFGSAYSSYPSWNLASIDAGYTGASWGGSLLFYTNNDSGETNLTERMRITADGNVGIATTNPYSRLTVARNGINEGTISYEDESNNAHLTVSGSDAFVRLQLGTYNNGSYSSWIQSSYDNSPGGSGSSGAQGLAINPQGGNVGIGTPGPSQKLHVSGNLRVTGAYYDSANGAGTSGQILSSTGTGTAWIAAPSGGGVTGSGTTNYVTKWTSGSAVGNSSIYDNGYVGIGTTAPAVPFEITVNSSVGVTGNVYFLARFLQDKVNYRGPFFGYDTGGSTAVIGAESAGPASSLAFYTYSSGWGERMRISGTNVGIGTTSPNNALTINRDTGAGNISSMPGVVFRNKNTTNSIFVHSGIFADTYRDIADPHYSGGIWFTRIPIASNLTSGSDIIFGTAGYVTSGAFPDERMRITWDGAVGIGSTAPTTTLDVRRNVPASSGTFPVVRVGNSSGDWGNYSMIEASNVPDGRAVRFGAYLGASAYSPGPPILAVPFPSPTTTSFAFGAVVPMPTLPVDASIRIRSL